VAVAGVSLDAFAKGFMVGLPFGEGQTHRDGEAYLLAIGADEFADHERLGGGTVQNVEGATSYLGGDRGGDRGQSNHAA
jgi:hypothetical protein